jgi:regulator of protease activity HflC (stomatin/prohibitin superfamily)
MSDGFPNPNKINPPNLKMPDVNLAGCKPRSLVLLGGLGLGAIIAFNLLSSSFVSVDANEIGVEIVRGKVQGTMEPGWHLVSPIGARVEKFSTRIEQTSMLRNASEGDRTGDDSVEAASREGATISVDITINYRLDKTQAVKLFNNVRDENDLRERLVRPAVRSVTRDIFAEYNAKDAITVKRGEIQQRVSSALNERFDGQGIIIQTVDIRELYLPENIQEQVNQSIAAEASAQKATIERRQKETEAETGRLVAEKSAERAIIEAQAQSDAAKIKAAGEAAANRAIAESLTPGLIQLRQIEAVYKNGNQVYFIPQGASPNVFLTPSANVGAPTPAQQQAAAETTVGQ